MKREERMREREEGREGEREREKKRQRQTQRQREGERERETHFLVQPKGAYLSLSCNTACNHDNRKPRPLVRFPTHPIMGTVVKVLIRLPLIPAGDSNVSICDTLNRLTGI